MVDRSPRVNVALSEAVYGKLERYAAARGSKVSTEAGYLLTKTLDELDSRGEIPNAKNAAYESLRELILNNWDALCDAPQLTDRLPEIRSGASPTRDEILEISIVLDLSGKYVSDLAAKGKRSNGTAKTR